MHSLIPKACRINCILISPPHLLLTLSHVLICDEKELLKFMQSLMSHAEVFTTRFRFSESLKTIGLCMLQMKSCFPWQSNKSEKLLVIQLGGYCVVHWNRATQSNLQNAVSWQLGMTEEAFVHSFGYPCICQFMVRSSLLGERTGELNVSYFPRRSTAAQWSNAQGNCRNEPIKNTPYHILIQFALAHPFLITWRKFLCPGEVSGISSSQILFDDSRNEISSALLTLFYLQGSKPVSLVCLSHLPCLNISSCNTQHIINHIFRWDPYAHWPEAVTRKGKILLLYQVSQLLQQLLVREWTTRLRSD